MVKILIDAMGGDNAPGEIIKGAIQALNEEKDLYLIFLGDEQQVKAELAKYRYDAERTEIVHCSENIGMDEIPTEAIKKKKDSTLVKGFTMLRKSEDIDAMVTAGSSGATIVGATLLVGRIPGVMRPALCPMVPGKDGSLTLICDCGANAECKPQMLAQFAVLSSVYAEKALGIEKPRVGLLNNGTEEHKGDALHQEAYKLIRKMGLNFVGNVEGRDICYGDIDIAVADGFSGNAALKGIEGCGKMANQEMRLAFTRNIWTKIGYALFLRKSIEIMKNRLDFNAYGGAMLLGLKKIVIKSHGSTKAKAMHASVIKAANAVRTNTIAHMQERLSSIDWELLNGSEEN